MTSKELFLKNKDLREQWGAVAHSDWFKQVLTFARAELMDLEHLGIGELRGAKDLEDILLTLADEEPENPGYPSAGLQHDLDKPRTPTTEKRKT